MSARKDHLIRIGARSEINRLMTEIDANAGRPWGDPGVEFRLMKEIARIANTAAKAGQRQVKHNTQPDESEVQL